MRAGLFGTLNIVVLQAAVLFLVSLHIFWKQSTIIVIHILIHIHRL
jgi:hypothetical protein